MTWRDWVPALLMVAAMAVLIGAYVLITRRANRERDEAIHSMAVPVTTAWGYPGIATRNANLLTVDAGTLRCTHMSVSGVTDASCTICGPLVSV